jgi:hypothetical protein
MRADFWLSQSRARNLFAQINAGKALLFQYSMNRLLLQKPSWKSFRSTMLEKHSFFSIQ